MKKYYYLSGKVQNGPFSIDELKEKNLSNETLVWTTGMENWQKLIDVLELQSLLKTMPPPPPLEANQPTTKTEISGQIKITNEKEVAKEYNILKPTKKQLAYYLIWICIHVVIFLLTKTKTDFIQYSADGFHYDRPERFWPFNISFYSPNHSFYGIFVDYDKTELLVYSLIPLVLFVIYRLTKNNDIKNY